MNRAVRLGVVAALLLLSLQYLPASAATPSVPSQAAAVVLTIIPPKLPADGGIYRAAVVSLVDSAGLPTAAFGNVTVFLASSLTNIADVPASVTIYAGQEYAIANVTTTTTPGTAMIAAHAEGLKAPAPVSLTTVTPSGYPSKLLVFASPSIFLPRADRGVLRVEVVDQAGLPSKAIDPIPVLLSSSNSSIASLGQSSLTIPAGSIFADGVVSTSSPGSAVITATSGDYSSGAALVTVNKPNVCIGSCVPYKLALKVVAGGSPGALPTDGLTYRVLEVGLQTSSGAPATFSSDTVVQLTSDQSEVASVPSLVTIPAGSISALASVTTSALEGVANVTAAAGGLLPATLPIKTVIPAPSKLQAYVAPPSSAFSTNGNYPIFAVQLQDDSGNPARARQNTVVVITSSNRSLLSNFTLGIAAGQDYSLSFLHVKSVGASVLTATSSDLASSQTSLAIVPSPLAARLLLSSTLNGFIYDNQTATFTFSISFVGQPVQHLNVTWTTSAGNINPVTGNTGTSGSTSAVLTPASPGLYNITASVSSLQTGTILLYYPLTVLPVPQKASPSFVEQLLGYWYYIVAVVAVAVVGLIYLFRMRRKKQRAEIEAGFEVV